jgi:hypothetical protein
VRAVDKQEARAILGDQIARLRERSYEELCASLLNDTETFEVVGASGTRYQVELQALWDSGKSGPLRVFAHIDDGGWRSFAPMGEDFVVAPGGSFVGE